MPFYKNKINKTYFLFKIYFLGAYYIDMCKKKK